jgi:hypothetical protein
MGLVIWSPRGWLTRTRKPKKKKTPLAPHYCPSPT